MEELKFEEESISEKEAEEEKKDEVESEVKEEPKESAPLVKKEESDIEKRKIGDLQVSIDRSKSAGHQAKELVSAAATAKAIQDQELVENITSLKKDELKANAESSLKEELTKSKEAESKLQAANYGVYEGIADLIGLKKPLPNGMLKILMLILMPLLIAYYVVFGVFTGIINITMDCVNAIVSRFAEFTKPARKVIIFVAIVAAIGLTFFVVWSLLKKYNVIA